MMASGPEHYRRAEQLVDNAWRHVRSDVAAPLLHSPEVRAALLATAQVHATLALALAAATAVNADRATTTEWIEATS